jgi:hypothetical protein
MITFNSINGFFNQLTELPERNIFSAAGFAALAEWSERQPWWGKYAVRNSLIGDWRSTAMGDSHLFALNLYIFLNSQASLPGREEPCS